MPWTNWTGQAPRQYKCGYCGFVVGAHMGFHHQQQAARQIYVCPNCDQPTYFSEKSLAVPGAAFGNEVAHLPADIETLYGEARRCTSASAFTGSVLLSRKLLMNIAVHLGAKPGEPFISYVEYLAANGYVPPAGKGWVDHIRKRGNEATHEIVSMKQSDAEELLIFLEMLLKFVYEFPKKIPSP